MPCGPQTWPAAAINGIWQKLGRVISLRTGMGDDHWRVTAPISFPVWRIGGPQRQ